MSEENYSQEFTAVFDSGSSAITPNQITDLSEIDQKALTIKLNNLLQKDVYANELRKNKFVAIGCGELETINLFAINKIFNEENGWRNGVMHSRCSAICKDYKEYNHNFHLWFGINPDKRKPEVVKESLIKKLLKKVGF